ncbi:diguanylate cyclase [Thiospirochaeta perfilievii]|uniref:diguanylate cyclase n=1 Tax=Thiospirochaeta perfilievii TaxID=252967 RepID=A0A5C1Q6T2_9SPIO|nr:diguanylate cyclase [Thiospirochaeta perfilievii]QEN03705.1 diguanylate cyclase [Thiospirochaeta perfilievii]
MDKRILLLEKNDLFGRAIKYKIESQDEYQVIWYKTYDKFIEAGHDYRKIQLGIIDYNIPDSNDGKILEYFHEIKIPLVLLSEKITHDIQEKIWSLKVIDYILTGNNNSLDSIVDVTNRFFNNPNIGILAVDNSKESRRHLKKLLKLHRYTIYEASTGGEALEILNDNFDKIQMVITDYMVDDIDGLQLTEIIRERYPMDRLAIIGISDRGNHTLKIQFIKNGANDFLSKPFISELLYCRITQNLKVIEYFKQIKELAVIDQLTKLNNRHFLKETGSYLFENARRHDLSLVTAMIDIDDFKYINDTYGHDAGDIVLKEVSLELKSSVRKSDLVIRFGGEEFLIIGNNLDPNRAKEFFEHILKKISERKIYIGKQRITVTVSIGVCTKMKDSLEEIIVSADKKLYIAKSKGKERVCL